MKVTEITLDLPSSPRNGLLISQVLKQVSAISGIRVRDLDSGMAQGRAGELSVAEKAAKRRYVNTGFSTLRTVMSSDDNARAEWRHSFWLEIGDLLDRKSVV